MKPKRLVKVTWSWRMDTHDGCGKEVLLCVYMTLYMCTHEHIHRLTYLKAIQGV